MKDPVAEGCRPALFAAASPDIPKEQIQVSRLWKFLSSQTQANCRQNSYIVPDKKVQEASKQARDEKLQRNLWRLTKEVLESKIGSGSLPYEMRTEVVNTA